MGLLTSWTHRFQGPCLLDAIDSLQPPSRNYSEPLLMPICDFVKSQSQGQVSVCGKVETGAIRSGSKVKNSFFFFLSILLRLHETGKPTDVDLCIFRRFL